MAGRSLALSSRQERARPHRSAIHDAPHRPNCYG
jgi:hypothetical protein